MPTVTLVLVACPRISLHGKSVPELVQRGTVLYFVLLAVFILMLRRTVGSIGIMELIVAVLIAEAGR